MRVRIIQPTKQVEQRKKKVCAYARVSTEYEKQNESLENQIQYYENLISSNPNYEFVGVFSDRGVTGTIENRPEFQRMLDMCRQGKIDLIIILTKVMIILLQTYKIIILIGKRLMFILVII